WLAGLGELVAEIEREWEITVGSAFAGGNWSFVAEATTADSAPAVVKVAMPTGLAGREALENEVRILRLADGHGCARLLRYDAARGARPMERLRRQLALVGRAGR